MRGGVVGRRATPGRRPGREVLRERCSPACRLKDRDRGAGRRAGFYERSSAGFDWGLERRNGGLTRPVRWLGPGRRSPIRSRGVGHAPTATVLPRMRVLVVSTLYPPVAFGGYERECYGVVERLRERHAVLVLTSDEDRVQAGSQADVRRELELLTPDARGALRAPLASLRAVGAARRALAWEPDLVYVWNASEIPQAALRVLADSGVPLAFRVCEHWFGGIFVADQFMRELLPADRGPARALWAAGCRAFNSLPPLRLDATAPLRTAISWNSEAIRAWCRCSRSSIRCSRASGTRCPPMGTSTPRSCASRHRTPRSSSSGGSPPTRELRLRSRRWRCCARATEFPRA